MSRSVISPAAVDLLVALVRACQEAETKVDPAERLAVLQVADLLGRSPKLAAAWGRVLVQRAAAPAEGGEPR